MKRRKLAGLLCLVLLLNICLPIASYGDSNKIQKLATYDGDIFDETLLLNQSTIGEIETYLSGKYAKTSSNHRYVLNPYVYQKYKIIAYTDQEAVDKGLAGLSSKGSPKKETQTKIIKGKNQTIGIEEYRYLGYKIDGVTLISNDFFPANSKAMSNINLIA